MAKTSAARSLHLLSPSSTVSHRPLARNAKAAESFPL